MRATKRRRGAFLPSNVPGLAFHRLHFAGGIRLALLLVLDKCVIARDFRVPPVDFGGAADNLARVRLTSALSGQVLSGQSVGAEYSKDRGKKNPEGNQAHYLFIRRRYGPGFSPRPASASHQPQPTTSF